MKRIDINADMGESYGRWTLGSDEDLLPYITSANIACGFHAGDWEVMARTVELARKYGVSVGAHPSYPDLQGFGRRHMAVAPTQLSSLILYQLGALWAIARSCGPDLAHVKPHGALYNDAMRNDSIAEAVAEGIKAFSTDLFVYCMPGSSLQAAAKGIGLATITEGFADRLYEPTGLLAERSIPGAVLDPAAATRQAVALAAGSVLARDGTKLELAVDTLCIHGDSPGAPATARAVRRALEEQGYLIASPGATGDA